MSDNKWIRALLWLALVAFFFYAGVRMAVFLHAIGVIR